jgi:CHASE2 domain-containing sensor protein
MSTGYLAWIVRAVTWMLSVGVLTLLQLGGWTRPADHALYDLHLRAWRMPVSNQVLIIAIDPKSLDKLGRWPWPRQLHARLLDRLTDAGVLGVGLDVTFSEPDKASPQADRSLADAIRRNGHVVLPVFAEARELGGMPEEMLPIPALASHATLGQVDVALGDDRLARGAYLRAGLGAPYWPSFALALYRQHDTLPDADLPGLRNDLPENNSPYRWIRDNYVLLRYAGPAGTIGRLSFVDVLDGKIPTSMLRGRWVLIGATAAGEGDYIATPASLSESSMPGVEYQANILESLLSRQLVTPLNFMQQLLTGSAMLLLVPLFAWHRRRSRAWVGVVGSMASILLLSIVLLRVPHLWWPPAACMFAALLGIASLWLMDRFVAISGSGAIAENRELPFPPSGSNG